MTGMKRCSINDHLTGHMVTSIIDGMEHEIAISEFKARCLELLERLRTDGGEIVVTKRGVPIARISPLGRTTSRLRGSMKDMLAVKGDIVECDWSDEWDVLG